MYITIISHLGTKSKSIQEKGYPWFWEKSTAGEKKKNSEVSTYLCITY